MTNETTATLLSLGRSKIRYWMFRIQTEISGGDPAGDDCPPEIRQHFEQNQFFDLLGGWEKFAATWDVSEDDPTVLIGRKKSIHQEWFDEAMKNAKMLPGYEHLYVDEGLPDHRR